MVNHMALNISVQAGFTSGEAGLNIYHTLCKKIVKTGIWPNYWKMTGLITIPKKETYYNYAQTVGSRH